MRSFLRVDVAAGNTLGVSKSKMQDTGKTLVKKAKKMKGPLKKVGLERGCYNRVTGVLHQARNAIKSGVNTFVERLKALSVGGKHTTSSALTPTLIL